MIREITKERKKAIQEAIDFMDQICVRLGVVPREEIVKADGVIKILVELIKEEEKEDGRAAGTDSN